MRVLQELTKNEGITRTNKKDRTIKRIWNGINYKRNRNKNNITFENTAQAQKKNEHFVISVK